MKHCFLPLILLLITAGVQAQSVPTATTQQGQLLQARLYLTATSSHYNPAQGKQLCLQLASQQNGQAMNMLGMIYNQGIGQVADEAQALSWFTQAVEAGYAPACYNLGMMYKKGYGVPQDFARAYTLFAKGAAQGEAQSQYMQGFMHYKGLGCQQDYLQALALFEAASQQGNAGAFYMAGLCYRNGYGTAVDLSKARQYLVTASDKGCYLADQELAAMKAENTLPPATLVKCGSVGVSVPKVFEKVSHQIPTQTALTGTYTGYLIRYDWSGQHVIGKTPLTLTLDGNTASLTGTWAEGTQLTAPIKAHLTDNSLVFDQTQYQAQDHYSNGKEIPFVFEKASLNLSRSNGQAYLTGNLQLYSQELREPEKPIYLSLKRQSTTHEVVASPELALLAYPNPFSHTVSLSFQLPAAQRVSVSLVDQMGRVVYEKPDLSLQAGDHTHTFGAELPAGVYVCRLLTQQGVSTTLVSKQ